MASVPYVFESDPGSGFAPNPDAHRSFGYVTSLAGFGLARAFSPDLQVFTPWNGARPAYPGVSVTEGGPGSLGKVTVVGVIEKFAWNGGVGDPLLIDFEVSQENATQIKALQQDTLKNTRVNDLGWWICDYDQETKVWFEQSYPTSAPTITGTISGNGTPGLDVDLTAIPVKDGIDVNVYKVSISVVPAANLQYSLMFANSSTAPRALPWGLEVGTLPSQ
jgi:hypothetical protein